jgi:hypothetical protein
MFSKEQWRVLWELMEASQRLGAEGAVLGDEPTIGRFAEAVEARQQALAMFLKLWGDNGEV